MTAMHHRESPLTALATVVLLAAAAILLLAVAATAADGGEAPEDRPPPGEDTPEKKPPPAPLRIVKQSASCYAAVTPGGRSNAGFVVGKDAVLVVDCLGSPKLARMLLEKIREVTDRPVRHLVLTHWHYDHSVGSQEFPEGVEILASVDSARRLEKRLGKDTLLLGSASGMHGSVGITKVRKATKTVSKQREIDLGGVVVKLAVAGNCHAAGDMVVYVPSEKVLFAGDLAWNGYHPNLCGGSTFRWISVLARLERFEFTKLVPGHGEPGDKEILVHQRRYLMAVRRLVKHLAKMKVDGEKILAGLEVPEVYKKLGYEVWWRSNIRFVYKELANGR